MNHSTQTALFDIATMRLIPVFFFALLQLSVISGQKDPLKEGNKAYEEESFREALIYYNQVEKIDKSAPILFKRGVCYYELNQLDRAIIDFQQAWEYGYKNPQVDYYTGLIQHHKGNFKLAATYYKKYLQETPIDQGDRKRVRQLIKQCGRAIDLSYLRPIAIVERLPKTINTVYDEVGMIESPSTAGKYYYTSNQPNTSLTMSASDYDVYVISHANNEWSEPKRMPYVINHGDEDVLVGFTQRADGIYFYRGEDFEGGIHVNSGRTKKINLPSNFNLVNSDVFFYDDHLCLFAAILPTGFGGYGGYDLYASINKEGTWSRPINLGPQINTANDEISPYLSQDGTELYFSSDRETSIGGLDIFFSTYMYEANRWGNPENLGIPINSPGDDTHFSLSYDGLTAMLSSNRKNAIGGKDVYLARFKIPRGQQAYTTDYLPFVDYHIAPAEEYVQINDSLEVELYNKGEAITAIVPDEETPELTNVDTPAEEPKADSPITTPSIETTNKIELEKEILPEYTSSDTILNDPSSEESTPQIAEVKEVEISQEIEQPNTDTPTNPIVKPSTKKQAIDIVEHTVAPIYYSTSQDLLDRKNQAIISQVKSLLESNPGMKLEIQGHTAEDGILEFKLFSSIKIAEKLEKEFVTMGIEDRRIHVTGHADNYPIALSEANGGDVLIASNYNSRIEFKLYDYNKSVLSVERGTPPIPKYSVDNKYEIYRALSDNALNYKIQIAIVGQMYRGLALDLFNDATVEEDEVTGLYLYTIGLYDNYAEALSIRRDVERLGITDARVIPYYDGRILTEDQLAYYVNEYPDLRNFMNYGN